MKWFDRTFELGFSASLLPNVVERLRGTSARVAERVAGVDPSRLTMRPPDGSWSIQENVGHLLDLEPLWRGRVEDILGGKAELRAADLTNQGTFHARFNERPMEEIVSAVRRERQKLLELLESLREVEASRASRHPRLQKPMRLIDHAFFVAEHDDHHLARITELLRYS